MINWIVRIKNKSFWLAIIPAVLLLVQTVAAVFGYSLDFWVGRVSAATVVWELSERLVRNTIPAVHSTSTTAARISVIRSRLASACCFLRWASRFSRRIFISSSCSGMASG